LVTTITFDEIVSRLGGRSLVSTTIGALVGTAVKLATGSVLTLISPRGRPLALARSRSAQKTSLGLYRLREDRDRVERRRNPCDTHDPIILFPDMECPRCRACLISSVGVAGYSRRTT
jgi:hypothetical protein